MSVGLLSSRAIVTLFIITLLNDDRRCWHEYRFARPRTRGNNSFFFIVKAVLVLITRLSLGITTVSVRDYWSSRIWRVMMRFWHARPLPAPWRFIGYERSIFVWLRRTFIGGNNRRLCDSLRNESKRSETNNRWRGYRSSRDHSMTWVHTWWLHTGLYPQS